MENFDRLYYHPDTGYVIRYKESGNIVMAYSILKIGFYPDEFCGFRKCLSYLMDKYAAAPMDETLKTVSIPTHDPAMEIVLSVNELRQLYQIIETADSEMKAGGIVLIRCIGIYEIYIKDTVQNGNSRVLRIQIYIMIAHCSLTFYLLNIKACIIGNCIN